MLLMEFSSLAFLAGPTSPASLLPFFLPIPFHTLSHHTYSDTVSLAHYKINIFFSDFQQIPMIWDPASLSLVKFASHR